MKTFLYPSLLTVGALLLGGCGRGHKSAPAEVVEQVARKEVKEARENLSALKGAVMKGGELMGGDSQGRPLWRVSADTIRTSGALEGGTPKQAILTNGKATLYRAGKPDSNLHAAKIILFSTPKGIRLQMSEGVTGETVGPWTGKRGAITIAAPRADVDVQSRIIAASGGVRMTQGALKITGQTLRALTSLEKVDVTGQVHGQSENGQVEAKSASYDWKNARLSARSVTATQSGTKITGDALEANTDASSGVLTGHVVAQGAQGNATAPSVAFDWKKNRVTATAATLNGQGGTLRAGSITTDSKLQVASATNLTAQKDGATLRAAFADGFDGLNRLRGRQVSFSRGDLTLTAPRADASKQGANWLLVATGGAHGQNAAGRVSAARVVWDEGRGHVEGSGGVTLEKDGSTLTGATLNSDTKFLKAVLNGNVHGRMQDGSTLTSGTLEKRGDRFFASNGATAKFKSKGSLGVLTLRGARLEAAADGSTAQATGGVTVSTATGATARAPQATYNRATGKITATGGVDFVDPQRGLRQHGDTLVADVNLKQITLSNVRGQGSAELFKGKKLF